MRDVAFSENSLGERRSRRSISRFFILLGALATGVHLQVADSGSEVADESRAHGNRGIVAEDTCLDFQATAYCESGTTKSGIPTSPGIVAADPRVLPLG